MHPEDVKAKLDARLDECEFHIQGEGCNFQVTAVSQRFQGMSPVKRQQLVLGALNDEITSGELHAISIRTFTPDQWAQQGAASS